MTVDQLIDRLAERINAGARELKLEDEVPLELRLTCIHEPPPESDQSGWWDWQVKRSDQIDWIAPFEAKLPCRLPRSFASLVSRYEFPEFEIGQVMLFANTRTGTSHELREEVFGDTLLSACLLRNGLVQFGRPNTGSYDPICFDTGATAHEREFPILWLDHEEILCRERIRTVKQVAASFYELVCAYVGDQGRAEPSAALDARKGAARQ